MITEKEGRHKQNQRESFFQAVLSPVGGGPAVPSDRSAAGTAGAANGIYRIVRAIQSLSRSKGSRSHSGVPASVAAESDP